MRFAASVFSLNVGRLFGHRFGNRVVAAACGRKHCRDFVVAVLAADFFDVFVFFDVHDV